RRVVAITDVICKIFAFLIPPPTPTDFIHGDIQRAVSESFSIAVECDKIYRMIAFSTNSIVIAVAFRYRKPDPILIGKHIKAAQSRTKISALFKYASNKRGR